MPNINADDRCTSPRDMVREMALVAHSLPNAELRVRFHDGRSFVVASHPTALMTPCLFRRAVSLAVAGEDVPWLAMIAGAELVGPRCRDLGVGLYAAWCAGAPVYAFASRLDPSVLEAAFVALPDCGTTVRLVPDEALATSLVTIEPATCRHDAEAQELARELQATILVEELVHTIGVR